MNTPIEIIKNHFQESLEAKQRSLEILPVLIEKAGKILLSSIQNNKKILSCGNGGSASDAQHFSGELLCRFEKDRPALPAIALTTDTSTLTAIGNDYHFNEIFSRQLSALGNEGDTLLAITTSGNSENIIKAIDVAHKKNIPVIALTGKNGGKIRHLLNNNDVEICVPAERTIRIQEIHILIIHALCDYIDQQLF